MDRRGGAHSRVMSPPLRFDGVMTQPAFIPSDERIVDTMIGLARIAKSHRIILAGSISFEMFVELHPRLPACDNDEDLSCSLRSARRGIHHLARALVRGSRSSARRACTFSQRCGCARDLGRSSSNVQSGTQAGAEKVRLSYRIRHPLRRRCGHICSTDRIEPARERRVRQ